MEKAVLYARLSEGDDINEQINEVMEYALNNNYSIAKCFIDLDKKGINKQKMIEFLEKSEIKNILVASMDRLTRKVSEWAKYEVEMGFKIIIAEEIEVIPALLKV